jgi:hypothetical protein
MGLFAVAGCASSEEAPGATVSPPGNEAARGQSSNPAGAAGGGSMLPVADPDAINPGTGGTGVVPSAGGHSMPCDIASKVQDNCQSCHGTRLLGGAPMPLLTHDDFHRDHVVKTSEGMVGQTMKVYQLAALRLTSALNPMPPSGSLAVPEDKSALLAWLDQGAPAAGQGDSCTPAAGSGGSGGVDEPVDEWDFNPPTPVLPGEQCFELVMHGGQTASDESPYMIKAGEYYVQFYFKVPWPENFVATKAGARYDAVEALHHWLLFTTNRGLDADGTHEEVIGTQLGDSAQLLFGWAMGGATHKLPEGVGLELPPPNTMLNVQWHYFNSMGVALPDRTAVIVCGVPRENVEHVATTTWLGTERIDVPPGKTATATGSCVNDSGEPIHIIGFVPHMHNIGIHMKSEVVRAGSSAPETVFDKPFSNSAQLQYNADVTLMPNDRIISTCTYQNDGVAPVGFGTSTTEEMCYQFAISYPAHALENNVISLIGAANTCWQFGE